MFYSVIGKRRGHKCATFQLGVRSDPGSVVYNFDVFAMLERLDEADHFWNGVDTSSFYRRRDALPSKQLEQLLGGIRCNGLVRDGDDIIECAAGIAHPSKRESRVMVDRLLATNHDLDRSDFA